jgi:hypothetical protein
MGSPAREAAIRLVWQGDSPRLQARQGLPTRLAVFGRSVSCTLGPPRKTPTLSAKTDVRGPSDRCGRAKCFRIASKEVEWRVAWPIDRTESILLGGTVYRRNRRQARRGSRWQLLRGAEHGMAATRVTPWLTCGASGIRPSSRDLSMKRRSRMRTSTNFVVFGRFVEGRSRGKTLRSSRRM